uniref:Uncharacterized protein n=1 Tax=Coturnix japonica TaxID=93934 RepID=A0A8C2THZ5_COTJA
MKNFRDFIPLPPVQSGTGNPSSHGIPAPRSGRATPAHHLRLPGCRLGWQWALSSPFLLEGKCVHMGGVYPSSSLVFAASSLSISAAALSAICWICSNTMVSSDTLLLNFFTWLMLLLLTFLKASLDLLVDCLASLARLSLEPWIDTHLGTGTRISVPSTSGFRFIPLSLIAFIAAAVWGDFCEICPSWLSGNFPSFVMTMMWSRVLTLRFLLKSSFRASTTACMSALVSSKLIISSTKAALMFSLACVCPLPLALLSSWKEGSWHHMSTRPVVV